MLALSAREGPKCSRGPRPGFRGLQFADGFDDRRVELQLAVEQKLGRQLRRELGRLLHLSRGRASRSLRREQSIATGLEPHERARRFARRRRVREPSRRSGLTALSAKIMTPFSAICSFWHSMRNWRHGLVPASA